MNSDELRTAYGDGPEFYEISCSFGDTRNSHELVREFHETFGHPVADEPTTLEDGRSRLRLELILEEVIELVEASGFKGAALREAADNLYRVREPDIVAIADALGDTEYVVNGAALEQGINLPAVVKEIHRSNMTKLGPDGKPIYREDGKILKGEGYERPDLESVLGL